VAEIVGGKAGGKGATSLGQGPEGGKAEEAVEVARKYLEGLKI
jgi:alanyl-tRNA synthetase